ncbi:MAG TPA: HAD family hydrolase, partial [Anaerolineales bacterium]|nr:HAD family hydrolase [Anaerolineales bacterium]
MRLTLLLDLDDTLMTNNMRTFLPAYFESLSAVLLAYAQPQPLIQHLLAATDKMTANDQPNRTLKEAFDAAFYPALGKTADDLQPELERFYAEDFPKLERVIKRRPAAIALVQEAFRRGYRVAVTTNPLFPRPAILHRLAWAGLPADEYPFELITSYESFHFTKPRPAYFAEALGRLGWPEGPVVVVGDDLENDI